jgi:hypothetical protein
MYGIWIKETTSTTGQGDVSLDGAMSGFAAFSSQFQDGDTVLYSIIDGSDRELGEGVYHAGNTLSRNTVRAVLVSGVLTLNPAGRLNLTGQAEIACTDDATLLNWAAALRLSSGKGGWVAAVDPADNLLKLSDTIDPGTY